MRRRATSLAVNGDLKILGKTDEPTVESVSTNHAGSTMFPEHVNRVIEE